LTLQALLRFARAWFGASNERIRPPVVRTFPTTTELTAKPLYEAVTRTYNALGAACGLLVLSPLLLLIGLGVRFTSAGPVLYRGERVGRHQRIFHILKFRTMRVGPRRPSANGSCARTRTTTRESADFCASTGSTSSRSSSTCCAET